MKKTLSLLRAVLSQDMNMFKYGAKANSSKLKKIIFPVVLFIIVCLSIGAYAYMIAGALSKVHLTYIMLTMFIFIVSILAFMQGIYKSQGILFEARDNDLLFSLPISRSKILFVRIFKLLLFQYIYNLMFLLPAFVIYIYFERPGVIFYIVSLIMTFLVPMIPIIISSILGYLVKLFSSKSRFKKIIQTVLTSIIFLGVFFLSSNIENFIKDIAVKANSINDFLTRIYYPIGLYINLVNKFNFGDLIKLILINVIPFILFIFIGSKFYFKIIANSNSSSVRKSTGHNTFIKRGRTMALVRKEMNRYFSSPVYMFNTSFGLLLLVVLSIALCIKGNSAVTSMLSSYNIDPNVSTFLLYYGLILFSTAMTSITSSCISLEGTTINITKSLPVSEKTILRSKIIYPFVIELPFILISELIFFIKFRPSLLYMFIIFNLSLLMILFSGLVGLIVNLIYPKLNASNDTEVVKQSMSSMISVFVGMVVFILSMFGIVYFNKYLDINLLMLIHLSILLVLVICLYFVLMKFGVKAYKKLNV